jgi:tRNA dimethylallyltransferase
LVPTVYIIAGPTAVGKTGIAITLAQHLGTSIVSADSRQCYQEMSIGTAKPSTKELLAVKHYFINDFPVTAALSAADYELLALKYFEEIFKTHNTAIVCGGTGLYIKALCDGLDEMPQTNPEIAAATEADYKIHGMEWLRDAVMKEDPTFYSQGEIYNPARLLRALSFIRTTGSSILDYRTKEKKKRAFRTIKVGLELPREKLYSRINYRVDNMMQEGLLAEVTQLFPYRHLKNLQTVGYTELFDYMENKYSLADAVNKIKQHTRNYAKRQMTWFKKDEEITWFRADDEKIIEKILSIK